MSSQKKERLFTILILSLSTILAIVGIAIIIILMSINNWGTFEIIATVGASLLVLSSIWIYGTFASATGMRARSYRLAIANATPEKAIKIRKRFLAQLVIDGILLLVSIILIIVGIIGVFA